MCYEHREDALDGGGSRQLQTHTHQHTRSVSRDPQAGWRQGQGSDAFLTHVCVAPPLITLMGTEHRKGAVGGGGCMQLQTQTHTQCHS